MSKKTISICAICGSEKCDGKEYKTEDMWGSYNFHIGIKIVCKNSPEVEKINGRLMYKAVSGYGDYQYYYLFPANYSDGKIKIEAGKLREQRVAQRETEEESQRKRHIEYRKKEAKEFINSMDKKDRIEFLKEFK